MNTTTLQSGMLVPNYRALCVLLDEPIKGGDGKKHQMKQWTKYFSYRKLQHTNAYEITEVLCTTNEPLPQKRTRTASVHHVQKTKQVSTKAPKKTTVQKVQKAKAQKETKVKEPKQPKVKIPKEPKIPKVKTPKVKVPKVKPEPTCLRDFIQKKGRSVYYHLIAPIILTQAYTNSIQPEPETFTMRQLGVVCGFKNTVSEIPYVIILDEERKCTQGTINFTHNHVYNLMYITVINTLNKLQKLNLIEYHTSYKLNTLQPSEQQAVQLYQWQQATEQECMLLQNIIETLTPKYTDHQYGLILDAKKRKLFREEVVTAMCEAGCMIQSYARTYSVTYTAPFEPDYTQEELTQYQQEVNELFVTRSKDAMVRHYDATAQRNSRVYLVGGSNESSEHLHQMDSVRRPYMIDCYNAVIDRLFKLL